MIKTSCWYRALLLISVLHFSGCAVIHFENGEVLPDPNAWSFSKPWFDSSADATDPGEAIRFSKWYHHGFYQLAEISHAMELSRVCAGLDWNHVTTSSGPLMFLIGLLDNALFIPASSAAIDLWSPWHVEYSCRYH